MDAPSRRLPRWAIVIGAIGCVGGLFFESPQHRFVAALVGAASPLAVYYLAKLLRIAAVKARRRNWLQFSLRGLLVAVLMCAIGLVIWDRWLRSDREQRRFIAAVKELGGAGGVDSTSTVSFSLRAATDDDLGLLGSLPGRRNVVQISLDHPSITDAGMAYLTQFPELTTVTLIGCKITDEGLSKLKSVRNLRGLHITGSTITDAGVTWLAEKRQFRMLSLMYTPVTPAKLRELKDALPYCDVVQDQP